MIKANRNPGNPIITPNKENLWEAGAVFNCGATIYKDKVYLLYRAIPGDYKKTEGGFLNYISTLGLAISGDGINFMRLPEPVIKPDKPFDTFGCEDPRITLIDDTYWITYTALWGEAYFSRKFSIGLAFTRDFKSFTKYGLIGPPKVPDKDCVIFPQKINNKFALLHRVEPDIQIAYFSDVEELTSPSYWDNEMNNLRKHLVLTSKFNWENEKVGAGPPPILTEKGWLLIYHGVDTERVYRAGVALLDIENPTRVIARLPYPLLEPELPYEIEGDVPRVVFPEGAVTIGKDLFIYYGAGDKTCCLATVILEELLDTLLKYKY